MNYTPNLSKTKTSIKVQPREERIFNFDEVFGGYNKDEAMTEAKRCLNCVNMPCSTGCPINNHIPAFIEKIREGDFEGAYQIISKKSNMPAVCGRVCQQDLQCESKCVRGLNGEPVGIGRLERFVADWHNENVNNNKGPVLNGHRVAVVGSGPASLACAKDLAELGYTVTIFEEQNEAGGILVYGIPTFRLPKYIVKNEVKKLKDIGVMFEFNIKIGKDMPINALFNNGYEAVFVATGCAKPKFMNIVGENLTNVYLANEFLKNNRKKNNKFVGKKVAVVGGGNVAIDVAETSIRLGAEKVFIVYRRSFEEMPAKKDEIELAKEDGVEFNILTNPVEIIGDKTGCVKSIKCIKMQLGEPDSSGRRRPVEIPGSEFEIETDAVVECIGSGVDLSIKENLNDIEVNSKGEFVVDDKNETTHKGVFAGGDIVSGPATVVEAMKAGKIAAKAIDEYIMKKNKYDKMTK